MLVRAGVPDAHEVLICVAADGDALQITWAARLLNPGASIVLTVHDQLWASVAMDLGADRVLRRDPVAPRLVGLRVPVVGGARWCGHPAVTELRDCDRLLLVLDAAPSGVGRGDL